MAVLNFLWTLLSAWEGCVRYSLYPYVSVHPLYAYFVGIVCRLEHFHMIRKNAEAEVSKWYLTNAIGISCSKSCATTRSFALTRTTRSASHGVVQSTVIQTNIDYTSQLHQDINLNQQLFGAHIPRTCTYIYISDRC